MNRRRLACGHAHHAAPARRAGGPADAVRLPRRRPRRRRRSGRPLGAVRRRRRRRRPVRLGRRRQHRPDRGADRDAPLRRHAGVARRARRDHLRADGAPAPAITVFLTDIEQFIAGARVLGAAGWQWPPALRDQILGRVLGRVLAHEIGHYVLRSPRHAADGLDATAAAGRRSGRAVAAPLHADRVGRRQAGGSPMSARPAENNGPAHVAGPVGEAGGRDELSGREPTAPSRSSASRASRCRASRRGPGRDTRRS